jgi:hypothetical protein
MFVWTEDAQAGRRRGQEAATAMYKRELEERAKMLLRLGRSPSFVKARLAANVAWDFPDHRAAHAADVDRIVDALAKRAR